MHAKSTNINQKSIKINPKPTQTNQTSTKTNQKLVCCYLHLETAFFKRGCPHRSPVPSADFRNFYMQPLRAQRSTKTKQTSTNIDLEIDQNQSKIYQNR